MSYLLMSFAEHVACQTEKVRLESARADSDARPVVQLHEMNQGGG